MAKELDFESSFRTLLRESQRVAPAIHGLASFLAPLPPEHSLAEVVGVLESIGTHAAKSVRVALLLRVWVGLNISSIVNDRLGSWASTIVLNRCECVLHHLRWLKEDNTRMAAQEVCVRQMEYFVTRVSARLVVMKPSKRVPPPYHDNLMIAFDWSKNPGNDMDSNAPTIQWTNLCIRLAQRLFMFTPAMRTTLEIWSGEPATERTSALEPTAQDIAFVMWGRIQLGFALCEAGESRRTTGHMSDAVACFTSGIECLAPIVAVNISNLSLRPMAPLQNVSTEAWQSSLALWLPRGVSAAVSVRVLQASNAIKRATQKNNARDWKVVPRPLTTSVADLIESVVAKGVLLSPLKPPSHDEEEEKE